ncbi:hypothetical protein D3C72_2171210 [compost metagenome]
MSLCYLTMFILQKVTHRTLEYAMSPLAHRRRMKWCVNSLACCLNTNHTDTFILYEWIEHADSITTATYSSYEHIRQSSFSL